MNLVHDVLDKLLVDRDDRPIGRVDSIVLALSDDGPPRVKYLETGVVAAARRLHPALGRWVRRVALRWLRVVLPTTRVSPALFRDLGVDIELDVDASRDRRFLRLEKRLARVVAKMPGSGS
jgi:hypothetical protein